jgi:hypothetical protein
MEINATMLVYFKESRRRKKDKGITMSMKAVTQKPLLTRKGRASTFSLNPLTTPGIRSPMMIK